MVWWRCSGIWGICSLKQREDSGGSKIIRSKFLCFSNVAHLLPTCWVGCEKREDITFFMMGLVLLGCRGEGKEFAAA